VLLPPAARLADEAIPAGLVGVPVHVSRCDRPDARARQVQRQRSEEQRIRLGELTRLVVSDEEVVGLRKKAVIGDEVEDQGAR
jgi:hypothetical protein